MSFLKLRISMIKFRRLYITKEIMEFHRPNMIKRANKIYDLPLACIILVIMQNIVI